MRQSHAVLGVLLIVLVAMPRMSSAEERPGDLKTVVDGNTRFALDLYSKLKEREGNLFLSPYSISSALAMTYAGARGRTASQMAETLHFSLPSEQLHSAFAELKARLGEVQSKDKVRLNTANSLWPQKKYPFLPEYLDLVRKHYGASITPVDYQSAPEAAREIMNGWVEKQTDGKIKDLIKRGLLNSLTTLVLINAIYFEGSWAHTFKPDETESAAFHLLSGKSVEVPMMHHRPRHAIFGYAEREELQILEMRYAGLDLSMIVFLPKERDGLPELERKLTPEVLTEWTSQLREFDTEVYFPRFKMTSQFRLEETLSSMGMLDAFSPRADLSGMDGRPNWLYISAVIHKAFVDVTERGTTAAAATAVIIARGGGPRFAVFRADHPFMFVIRDNQTNSILFIGRVVDPTAQGA